MQGFTHEDFLRCIENEELKSFILKEYSKKDAKEKRKVDKKHDKIFKTILSNKKEGEKYIKRMFNIDVRQEDIEVYDKEFRVKGGGVLEADIIYKVKDKKIFYLVEHQTKKYYKMPFKILNYEVEIMRRCSAQNKNEKEGIVLASVIHTGLDKWDVATNIREVQEKVGEEIEIKEEKIGALGSYRLLDINDYTKEELLKGESLLDKVMYLEKLKDTKEFIDGTKKVFKRIEKSDYEIMSEVIRISLSGNMPDKEIEELIKELRGGEEHMLAIKERIDAEFRGYRERGLREGRKEGRKEGRREGRKEGRREEKLEIAKNLLIKGYEIEEIKEITNLTEEEINKIEE